MCFLKTCGINWFVPSWKMSNIVLICPRFRISSADKLANDKKEYIFFSVGCFLRTFEKFECTYWFSVLPWFSCCINHLPNWTGIFNMWNKFAYHDHRRHDHEDRLDDEVCRTDWSGCVFIVCWKVLLSIHDNERFSSAKTRQSLLRAVLLTYNTTRAECQEMANRSMKSEMLYDRESWRFIHLAICNILICFCSDPCLPFGSVSVVETTEEAGFGLLL